MIRVDLHVHSSASFDCAIAPEQIAQRCKYLGLSPVFLTDHDTINGAARLQRLGKARVVAGEEIMTISGELIGLFLNRPIQAGLEARNAALEIKEQGGLVYLEHPYDQRRRNLKETAIEEIADLIDIVEVFNGRSEARANERAQDLCNTVGSVRGAGSDAHSLDELGRVYVEMDDFDGPTDFLTKLRGAKIVVGRPKYILACEALLRSLRG